MNVFQRILAGELRASFVHEGERCVAFMDIRPMSRGHVLVVPRQAVRTLAELDAATRDDLWQLAYRVAAAQQRALGSRAQHFLVNDGEGASQTVPHVHVHVVPRYGGDTLRAIGGLLWHLTTLALPRPETAGFRRRLDAQADAVRDALASTPAAAR